MAFCWLFWGTHIFGHFSTIFPDHLLLENQASHNEPEHPPAHHPLDVHYEGWMVTGVVGFLLGSSSLVNHGGYLGCFFYYLSTNNSQAGY
jgi:hypothetical protein